MLPSWQRAAEVCLWGLVGGAKAMALVVLLTAPDAHMVDIGAWLALAFGLAALAVCLRNGVMAR